ncbi:ABC-type transporter Mla MlaB component [Bradyrhizobium japonicum]
MNSEPMLLATPSGAGLELRRPWIAANVSKLEALSQSVRADVHRSKTVTLDMAGVSELDTLGAWLLEKLSRRAASPGRSAEMVGIADNFRGLMDEVRQVNRHNPLPAPVPNPILDRLHDLGKSTVDAREDIAIFLQMLGALFMSLIGILRRPRSLRLTSLVYQLYRIGWQAIPIVMLITFLIGAIIAQQGFFHFRRFGAASECCRPTGTRQSPGCLEPARTAYAASEASRPPSARESPMRRKEPGRPARCPAARAGHR